MRKNLNIIVIGGMVALVVLVIVATALIQNANYASKNKDMNEQIATLTVESNSLSAAKDANGFSPTDVTKAFITEVKSGNTEKAKLYLDASVQKMDIQGTLKLGSDLANLTIGESSEQIEGDTATVALNVTVDDTTTAREFTIIRVDNVWKIKGVVAE